MTLTLFITMLTFGAGITSLLTEAVKKAYANAHALRSYSSIVWVAAWELITDRLPLRTRTASRNSFSLALSFSSISYVIWYSVPRLTVRTDDTSALFV